MSRGKARVAILGGGPAGIAAAYELSKTDELCEAFHVTVFQQGWRLGGKGASGRTGLDASGRPVAGVPQTIEEHGLHVWFGFYHNAFQMMEDCFAALAKSGGGHGYADLDDAFTPIDRLLLAECDPRTGEWWADSVPLPALELDAANGYEAFVRLPDLVLRLLRHLLPEAGAGAHMDDEVLASVECKLAEAERTALQQAHTAEPDPGLYRAIARPLAEAAALSFESAGGSAPAGRLSLWRRARRLYRALAVAFDFASAAIVVIGTGVVPRVLAADANPFDELNGIELREALADAGARPETLDSSAVRGLYDLAFAYEDGRAERPNVAAGVALENLLGILFRHRGRMMGKLNGGMGDVVFAPLYRLLRERKVEFEFFSAVSRIGVARSCAGLRVEEVEITRQAGLAQPDEPYDPLVELDVPAWPAEPIADRLDVESRAGLDFLRAGGGTGTPGPGEHPVWALERHPPAVLRELPPRRLRCDASSERDRFDYVVAAIPIWVLAEIAPGLRDEPALARMADSSRSVATQALQVWLGPKLSLDGGGAAAPILGAYAKPFDTCLDFSHVIAREGWPAGHAPERLAYLCGVLAERDIPAAGPADGAARANAERFLREHAARLSAPFWQGLDPGDLHDRQGRKGWGRLDAQYWRANATGSERYARSPAGLVADRLRADGSHPAGGGAGLDNLALAGDWTYTAVNAGSVEAAVMSGTEAAASVIGTVNRHAGTALKPPQVEEPPWRR